MCLGRGLFLIISSLFPLSLSMDSIRGDTLLHISIVFSFLPIVFLSFFLSPKIAIQSFRYLFALVENFTPFFSFFFQTSFSHYSIILSSSQSQKRGIGGIYLPNENPILPKAVFHSKFNPFSLTDSFSENFSLPR